MADVIAFAVHDGLFKAEGVDQEADEGARVGCAQGRPDLRWRRGFIHTANSASGSQSASWTFRNSSASHRLGGLPASSPKSRARWAWS